ncbi:MAG: hypothetical protein WCX97_04430 [Candidatus Magasanikbacteria bacterium]|jgi:hypothetical protein
MSKIDFIGSVEDAKNMAVPKKQPPEVPIIQSGEKVVITNNPESGQDGNFSNEQDDEKNNQTDNKQPSTEGLGYVVEISSEESNSKKSFSELYNSKGRKVIVTADGEKEV